MGKFKKWFEKFPELVGFAANHCKNNYLNSTSCKSMYSGHTINTQLMQIEETINKTYNEKEIQELINKQKDIIQSFKMFKRLMNKLEEQVPYQSPLITLSKFTMDGNDYTADDVLSMSNINHFNKKIFKKDQGNFEADETPCCVCTKELQNCNIFEYDDTNDNEFKKLNISNLFVIGCDCMETVELLQLISIEPKYKEIFEEKIKEWEDQKKTKCVKCEKLFQRYTEVIDAIETPPMNVCKKCIKQIRKDREADKVKKELEKQKQLEENIKQNKEKILMIRKKKKEEEELFNLYWDTYQW